MNKEVDKNPELVGYQVLYRLFNKLGGKFLKVADDIFFLIYRLKFGQRDDDIYIVTYPKSGTTIMQVVLYQLTTDGDMNFDHIYDVSPWIRNHSFKKLEPPQLPSPRIIKSHDGYKTFEKGTKGRFIHVYRNGMDVAVSQYHQVKNYVKPDLEFDEFLKEFLDVKAKGGWFQFNKRWFENKWKRPVLYVKYEDLLSNKYEQIQRVIKFCNLKVDESAIVRAIECSSFEYMKQNENKFGERPPETSKLVYNQFIRKGSTGEGNELFKEPQKDLFYKYYNKHVKHYEQKAFSMVEKK